MLGPVYKVDVEGTVEPGILGASWCPDDSLLALVTSTFNNNSPAIYSAKSTRRGQIDSHDIHF